VYSPPKTAGIDDDDLGPLVQRADDTLETVTRRLDVYERETAPLIDFYAKTGLLGPVDAMQPVDDVTKQIVSAIESRGGVTVS
jgi:adenylate kinase